MARRSRFDAVLDRALRRTDEIAQSLGTMELPIRLSELAHPLRVRTVRFEPLLSSAGLEKTTHGFNIIVNTEAYGASHPAGTVLDASGGAWADLAPPIRFSVAHEMAHVIFIQVVRDESADLLRRKQDLLEVACNQIAGRILVPAQAFKREVSDQLLNASHLRTLASKFRVSPEVLVRRLRLRDTRGGFRDVHGYVGLFREAEGSLRMVASQAFGPHAQGRFGRAVRRDLLRPSSNGEARRMSVSDDERRSLDDLDLPPEVHSFFSEDHVDSRQLEVACSNGLKLPCNITTARCSRRPTAFLIAIEVTGSPEDTARPHRHSSDD